MKVYELYTYVFDDVAFGIDVRAARKKMRLSQQQLAEAIGFKDGTSISQIERAVLTEQITIRRYYKLCSALNLKPHQYTDITEWAE